MTTNPDSLLFSPWVAFSLVLILVLMSAFFSGVETAFVCSDLLKIKQRKARVYMFIRRFFNNPERFLTTILVGNNITMVLLSTYFSAFLLSRSVKNAPLWSSLLITPFVLVFCEMFPKLVGRVFKERAIIKLAKFYAAVEWLLIPITLLIEKVAVALKKKLGLVRRTVWARDDIRVLISTLHSSGELDRAEKEALDDVFGFSKRSVKDISRRIQNVVGFDHSESLEAILDRAKKVGYTRYPVFKDREMIGYVNVFDLFYNDVESWQDWIRPITVVGANQKLDEIFALLTRKRESITAIQKGKRKIGIVTLQDLMREITESITKEEE